MSEAPRLRQINVTYVSAEDRLMLKVSTSDEKEYRAWCTRRLTSILLERLEISFEKEVDEKQVVPQAARREAARIKHGGAVEEKAFQQPYQAEPAEYPLGEDGMLVTAFTEKVLESGSMALTLKGSEGKGLTLNLDNRMRHQLYELLNRAVTRAGWFDKTAQSEKPVVH
ncbi:MAG: hypothetical protein V2J89_15980 [Halieaceae bacterium]|jgi:hypothetical protein|nr:hypothetical protein [Halieaceae bacterium]